VYDAVGLRILSWNLFHGRAVPPAGRNLLGDFSAALAGWEWDVALLQEVPPWWPLPLATACAAHPRYVLTSRNLGLPARRAIATRFPDAIKSNGGGANAILVRGGPVSEHRAVTLARVPERRRMHAVRLRNGAWVGNLHCSAHFPHRAAREAAAAEDAILAWADRAPAVLGGDCNAHGLTLTGLHRAAVRDVDYVFVSGLEPARPATVLDSRPLSDHPPLLIELA
jgi:endonuclease/exonuclease/phosphatase family metal-dependent hydrolase